MGGYCVSIAGTDVSGSWRELRGVRLVLLSVAEKLWGKTVCHRTDNINMENILKVGSPRPKLHACLDRWTMMTTSLTQIFLQPWIFCGGPTLSTGSLPSRHAKSLVSAVTGLNPCAEGIDAFTFSWARVNNWMFPPPYLIPQVLKHMDHGQEYRMLVIPLWTSVPRYLHF